MSEKTPRTSIKNPNQTPVYQKRRFRAAMVLSIAATASLVIGVPAAIRGIDDFKKADELVGQLQKSYPTVRQEMRGAQIDMDKVDIFRAKRNEFSYDAAADIGAGTAIGTETDIIIAQQGNRLYAGETFVVRKSDVHNPHPDDNQLLYSGGPVVPTPIH